ncbi:hypothetical protein EYF80_050830 [Liparis tanakae]|uniref:Uncharacterized protein n=1 Tax=Liparis tanakae TaxID=230148 RepID=A0A4Z2FCP4_9TELE|nr:hypothetical protein EYF80_050830 [Liparis tanakae]
MFTERSLNAPSYDGGAADLGQLAALAVEGPAADLVSDHVLDEEDAAVEAEGQPVEQLDVLQQVVVGVAVETGRRTGSHAAARRALEIVSYLGVVAKLHQALHVVVLGLGQHLLDRLATFGQSD